MRKRTTGLAVFVVTVLSLAVVVLPAEGTQFTAHMKLPSSPAEISSKVQSERSQSGLIWDNGAYDHGYSWGWASQLDVVYPFNAQTADDFMLESDMMVTGVNWSGCFITDWPCNPETFNIIIYADDGSGTQPTGAGMQDPTSTALAFYCLPELNGTQLDQWGLTYGYNVTFPEPFAASAHVKYWLVAQCVRQISPYGQWLWLSNGRWVDQLHGPVQGFPVLDVPFWTPLNDPSDDMAFRLYGEPQQPSEPDLSCSGSLVWSNVKPDATVNGSFQVMNVGEPDSQLNWAVASCPDWGTWTFTPSFGTNLTPDDGPLTVNVKVVAPPDKKTSFNGTVRVVNIGNTSDYCDIPVTLVTPLNQGMHGHSFFTKFLERFPHAFPLLRHLYSGGIP